MIRELEDDDSPQLLDAVLNFDHTGLEREGLIVDPTSTTISLLGLQASKTGFVYVAESAGEIVGLSAGRILRSFYDCEQLVGQLIAWDVVPEHRSGIVAFKLFRAFEKRAKNKGADVLRVSHVPGLTPESVEDVYERLGYGELESYWMKEVTHG